jgi:hypothetical protein
VVSTKVCSKCGQEKPLDEFYPARGMRDGRRSDCKVCNIAAKKERYRRDPELAKARVRAWQQANRERYLATQRRLKQTPEAKRRDRAGHLRRKYGITLGEYDALLARQGGVCAICRRPPNDEISLHVDHEHGTGRIRGALCVRCNNGLGLFQEDPALFASAVRYLSGR